MTWSACCAPLRRGRCPTASPMNSQNLYDLSPSAQLLLGAATLTGAVLLLWWWRQSGAGSAQRRRALLVLTLFLSFDLVMVGAFTRLTDSGLGCPEWPGCYGSASPLGAHAHIASAQDAMPSGPVTHAKAWIEMVHRYLAMTVGGLILVQVLWAWRERWSARAPERATVAASPWWITATLLWIGVQGAFGAWTVTMQLFPAIVSLHLLGAYVLLVLLMIQLVLTAPPPPRQTAFFVPPAAALTRAGLVRTLGLALGVVLVQAMLGAWVSTNYAVLACRDVPTCQGQWWPAMDFATGFQLWRPLGSTADGGVLSFQALTAIHFVHRLFAVLAVAAVLFAWWRSRQLALLQQPARWLALLLVVQVATGLSNVVLDWPLLGAVLHTGGAGGLIVLLTWMLTLMVRAACNVAGNHGATP